MTAKKKPAAKNLRVVQRLLGKGGKVLEPGTLVAEKELEDLDYLLRAGVVRAKEDNDGGR